jgi:phosphoribosylformylglycinamidine synthase
VRITRNNRTVFVAKRDHLQRTWSETSWRLQALRDNPECAREEYDRIIEPNDPGLSVFLTYQEKNVSISGAARPRIAILREQGVNGQVEMAAAFDRAGF